MDNNSVVALTSYALALMAGLIAGIIINYIVDVYPYKRKFTRPFCLSCQAALTGTKYILGLPCHQCGSKRSLRWYIALFTMPVVFMICMIFDFARYDQVAFDWLLIIFMAVIFIIDLEHRVILNELAIIGILICGLLGVLLHGWQSSVFGGMAVYSIMLILYLLGKVFLRIINRLRKTKTEDDALGYGDVNLWGLLGLRLGWPGVTAG